MKNNEGILIGVDLGGTNVRAGAFSLDGELLLFKDKPIEAANGPEQGIVRIVSLIEDVKKELDQAVIAIGIGSTGPLDLERGCIQNPYTLPGWEDVDIVSPLKETFNVPVVLENDADAAALGESWIGAGKGAQRLAMITLGTGVGTALILEGKIYRGVDNAHPEGGHIIVDPSGPVCYCGAHGCWESLVSGPAIGEYARKQAAGKEGYLNQIVGDNLEKIDSSLVFEGARQRDPLCLQIVDRTANYIALGLITVIMLYLPDCIVLTGGVMRSFDLVEEKIQAVIQRHDVIVPARKVKLQLAHLGQQAGIYGAARAAQILVNEETHERLH